MYIYLIMFFFYAPILLLIVYSFNASRSGGVWGGFTLKWYEQLFKNSQLLTALYYTFLCAVFATVISTVAGTISAVALHFMRDRTKNLLLNINHLPVINPDIITGISMMLVFSLISIDMGFITMLIAHITFCIPYVILSVLPKLRQMDKNMIEASLDLGASPIYTLRKVIIPEIAPGITTGALLAFTLSIDDFVISFFNTGSGVTNLSIYVYTAAKRGISPEINALSTIMILTVSVLLVIINRRTDNNPKKKGDR